MMKNVENRRIVKILVKLSLLAIGSYCLLEIL